MTHHPFSITFLGHQSWLFACAGQHLLVDPVLTDAFGHRGLVGRTYPRRVLDCDRFPRIHAVIVTHEHDDHLDLPSLNLIDRRVPIYLSSRSSAAAGTVLENMGFVVHRLGPQTSFDFGSLTYRSLVGALDRASDCDEWDVFPFSVADKYGHGRFTTAVDAPVYPDTWQPLSGSRGETTLFAYANNFTDSSFQSLNGTTMDPAAPTELAGALTRRLDQFAAHCGRPKLTVICGAGWRYTGRRAWINPRAFPVSNVELARATTAARPEYLTHAAVPGDTWRMIEGRLQIDAPAEFVGQVELAAEVDEHAVPDSEWLHAQGPALGEGMFSAADERRLLAGLGRFAEFLYGRPVYRQLHSLGEELQGRRASLCLSLLVRGQVEPIILEYDPRRSGFFRHTAGESDYASGLRCWASDLLAFMEGRLAASAMCYAGRLQTWNRGPSRLRFSAHDLWMYGHPLRSAEQARALYAHAHQELDRVSPVILAPRA